MSIIEYFLSVVAPHHCVGCGAEGRLLCSECSAALAAVPARCYACSAPSEGYRTCPACREYSAVYRAVPVTAYDGVAKQVVHQLKFARAQAAAHDLAEAMAYRLSTLPLPENALVTHVPTAAIRMRQRGYDQAALLARELAKRLRAPSIALLARSGSQRQVGQGRLARKQQMADAFHAQHARLLAGRHILLVDDVLTTGATCEAAARALMAAGAARVEVAVFAVA